jgi:hypothetical protein
VLALTVYAVGKTFFWPTMLAVASDRFPRSGAVAISFMGGIGMLSGGLLGASGLGYAKDRFASQALQATDPATYEAYKSETKTNFFPMVLDQVYGLDGAKLGEAKKAKQAGTATPQMETVLQANELGDRKTLRADSAIPAAMAVIYLGILIYFSSIGGYRRVEIEPGRG